MCQGIETSLTPGIYLPYVDLKMKVHIGALILMAAILGCTEAATIPGDRQFRASWGGPSDDPGLARGNLNSQLSQVMTGGYVNTDVVAGLTGVQDVRVPSYSAQIQCHRIQQKFISRYLRCCR